MTKTFAKGQPQNGSRDQWARNIAYFRKLAAFETQADLAEALGVTRQAVTFWESGERAPRDEMRARIAHALGFDVLVIFPPIRDVA